MCDKDLVLSYEARLNYVLRELTNVKANNIIKEYWPKAMYFILYF